MHPIHFAYFYCSYTKNIMKYLGIFQTCPQNFPALTILGHLQKCPESICPMSFFYFSNLSHVLSQTCLKMCPWPDMSWTHPGRVPDVSLTSPNRTSATKGTGSIPLRLSSRHWYSGLTFRTALPRCWKPPGAISGLMTRPCHHQRRRGNFGFCNLVRYHSALSRSLPSLWPNVEPPHPPPRWIWWIMAGLRASRLWIP